jgi:hypothetical protein
MFSGRGLKLRDLANLASKIGNDFGVRLIGSLLIGFLLEKHFRFFHPDFTKVRDRAYMQV